MTENSKKSQYLEPHIVFLIAVRGGGILRATCCPGPWRPIQLFKEPYGALHYLIWLFQGCCIALWSIIQLFKRTYHILHMIRKMGPRRKLSPHVEKMKNQTFEMPHLVLFCVHLQNRLWNRPDGPLDPGPPGSI